MGFLIQTLAQYAPWIYAFCGLAALYQIYKVWQVRTERRQAVFSLERELALRELYAIFAVVLLILAVMGATYFISTTLAEAVDIALREEDDVVDSVEQVLFDDTQPVLDEVALATNTPVATALDAPPDAFADGEGVNDAADAAEVAQSITATQPLTDTAEVAQVVPAPELPTATPPPTFTPTPAAVVQAAACPDGRAVLNNPGNGQSVSGLLSVVGTATHEQFQFFKIEYAPGVNADGNFAYVVGDDSPVSNGVLGTIDTTNFTNGPWTLRLVVVDNTGNFLDPPCKVTINVQN